MNFKKYIIDNHNLMQEWDPEKNNELGLFPNELTYGSNTKVWWKCEKGHKWQANIKNRNNGSGCPVCCGKQVLKGYNDLLTVNPNLTVEWNYEKNGDLEPSMVTSNCHQKVWWKCEKGHEWQAEISNRNYGHGCPFCSGKKALKGYNDLSTVNPDLTAEWNYEKNGDLKPSMVTSNSGKKVWWKCKKGHEWQATINHRSRNRGCPYCGGKKVLKRYNDLQTVNPVLAKEWNYELNDSLKPEHFTANSGKKVWWKCKKGHEWKATIKDRNYGCGCPVCNSEQKTSFPEYALVFYLEKYGLETKHSYKEKGFELDVYIPDKNIAIEYDGYYWHKNKTKQDLEKNSKCEKYKIKLYRIREGLPPLNDSSLDFIVQKTHKNLSSVLEKVLSEIIGTGIDVDLGRDSIAIENLREYKDKVNSFLFSNPETAKEWNYEKNGCLRPEHFSANSGKKVWWKCKKGHEWRAIITSRNNGSGCPICSGNQVLKGFNDLLTINPSLALEWNYKKNGDLKPSMVTPGSHKKIWWECEKGHEWQAVIGNRNQHHGCPYCAKEKRKVIK